MKRNLNQSKNGRRVLDTSRTGVLGSEVPNAGQNGSSLIYDEVTNYSLQTKEVNARVTSTNLPDGTWHAWPDGRFETSGSIPDGKYFVNYDFFIFGKKQSGFGTLNLAFGSFAPYIVGEISGSGVAEGRPVTLSIHAVGTSSLTYQWQRQPSGGGGFADIVGANAASYTTAATTITGGTANNGDKYRCTISNVSGSITSNAFTLSVIPAAPQLTFTVTTPPGQGAFLGFTGSVPVTSLVLTAPSPSYGTVGNPSAEFFITYGSGVPPGSPVTWNVSVTNGTATPSSGTVPGTFYITPASTGTCTVSVTNTGGLTNPASVDYTAVVPSPMPTPTSFMPRNAQPMLFQPINTRNRTVTLDLPHPNAGTYVYDLEADGSRTGTGPTATYIDLQAGWEWNNLGGDWIDSTLTKQGTASWANSITSAANNTEYSVNVTNLFQYVQTQNRWAAFLLRYTVGIRVLASHRHDILSYRPRVDITYTDNTTEVLDITTMAAISTGSTTPSTWGQTMQLPVMVETERPSKPVLSAFFKFTVTGHFGSPGAITFMLLDPSTSTALGPDGIAATQGEFDAGITSVPGVILAQRYIDGSVRSDFISNESSSINDTDFDPILYGISGTPDPTKFPQRSALKWMNAADLTYVDSTYTADGFEPLAPGLGAIKVTIPKTLMYDGYIGSSGGALGTTAKLFLPLEYMSTLQHGRLRYYVRFAFERPPTLAERYLFVNTGGSPTWWVNYSGKFGPSFNHNTPLGGVSASAGGGLGWQGRMQWTYQIQDTPGPNLGGINLAAHIKSDFSSNQPDGHNYNSMGSGFNERLGQLGGYGGMIQEQQWHLVEIDFKLNTVTNSGLGYLPDGHWKVWLNNRLVFEQTNMVMRTLPINYGISAPVITPGSSNAGNGSFVDLAGYSANRNTDGRAIPETIAITFTSATTYNVVGSFYGTYATGTVGVDYLSARKHRWRIVAGVTPWQAGDTISVVYNRWQGPAPKTGTLTPQRDLGIRDLWFNWFHGGTTEPPMDIHGYITGLVVADGSVVSHIGPMKTPAVLPSWVTSTPVNTWKAIPSSNTLSSLNPDTDPLINPNHPATAPWRSTGNWDTITSAWNGMAWDEENATGWWVDAGGHNDQHANGVIKFNLNSETPSYTRVRKPSGAVGMATIGAGEWNQSPQVAEFSDGRPRARHTVNATFYWPGVGPGNITEILLSPSGGFEYGRLKPYVISETTGERVYLGANKNNEPSGGWCASCYDPVRNVMWKMPTSSNTPFSKWGGPTNDVWTDVGASRYFSGSVSMTYIPGLDVILVGNGGNDAGTNQTVLGGWAVFDPATGSFYTPTFTGAPTSLPAGDASGLWPGITQPRWSARLGAVLAWDMDTGHTTKVLKITPPVGNPRTNAWTLSYLPISGANAVTPTAAPAAGTYGKFFVWDVAGICGVIPTATQPGFIYRYI